MSLRTSMLFLLRQQLYMGNIDSTMFAHYLNVLNTESTSNALMYIRHNLFGDW